MRRSSGPERTISGGVEIHTVSGVCTPKGEGLAGREETRSEADVIAAPLIERAQCSVPLMEVMLSPCYVP